MHIGVPPFDDRHARPTVILESGEMLGQALHMDDLRLRLSKEGVVCTYDRAGSVLLMRCECVAIVLRCERVANVLLMRCECVAHVSLMRCNRVANVWLMCCQCLMRVSSALDFCSYDGAGFGWSEVGGADRGPKQVAAELAFLLTVLRMCCECVANLFLMCCECVAAGGGRACLFAD